ncbi:GntR family transcriptional regulator [Ruminococcus sp. OA3]|uniref:GntR family transcriptional regulator n=1 Tax=Ruminococcus sp. OA3 TaxID=2914164 RepID=UPI001F06E554|nr:GntR family transcriptional regulator [Ruminococcus sp. OA3]MCH1981736.1 GntR family transcriptional regulator [Ruminococcus sp. OA3]
MEKKRTLFHYLYQNLSYQITTGYLPHGAALPSINQLCQIYHVGIRTVKDVLAALKSEGLICSQERKPTVVIYRPPDGDSALSPTRNILEQKDSILDVYETITLLMPRLFSFSALSCGDEVLSPHFHSLTRCKPECSAQRWHICSSLLHDMLDSTGNLLFRDIFTSLELHARVPFFLNSKEAMSVIADYTDGARTQWVMDSLKEKDPGEIQARFSSIYCGMQNAIARYLNTLSQTPDIKPSQKNNCFFWNAETGRDHYYMQITRDLIDKIGIGLYKDGEFLPPQAELALQYNVSVSTIRKAMSTLNELGFAETFNAKGTQVTLFNGQATCSCMKNRTYKNDTLLYLSALQFMAIAIQPAVRLAFPHIERSTWDAMRQRFGQPDIIPLDHILQCITEQLPLQPLCLLLQETNKLLHWGYYYSFYLDGNRSSNTLNQMCLQALDLLNTKGAEAFSRQLSLCYCHVFEFVRDFMVGRGLPEARSLVTPDPGL